MLIMENKTKEKPKQADKKVVVFYTAIGETEDDNWNLKKSFVKENGSWVRAGY